MLVLPVVSKHYTHHGANCYDAITNGDLDLLRGPTAWTVASDDGYPLADGTWFYEGHYGAYLGGYDDLDGRGDVDDSLGQFISIPANAQAEGFQEVQAAAVEQFRRQLVGV